MDLSKLDGEVVFACNAVHLLFDRIAWRPDFYVSVDSRTTVDRASEISKMLGQAPSMTAFFPATLQLHDGSGQLLDTRRLVGVHDNAWFFNEVANSAVDLPHSMFSLDVAERVVMPYTVAITMMQLAAYMGFSEIHLIGCDTRYVVPPSVSQSGPKAEDGLGLLLTSTADDDPNHFDPRYFGKGKRWHNPQVARMIEHYQHARIALDGAGIKVFNATVGGDLEVFPRVDFNALFQAKRSPLAAAPEPTVEARTASAPVEPIHATPVVEVAPPAPAVALDFAPTSEFDGSHLIIAGAGAFSAMSLSDLNARPVMVMAAGLGLFAEIAPTYVAAVDPTDAEGVSRLTKVANEGLARRILAPSELARALPSSERVVSLEAMRPFFGAALATDAPPMATALLWAKALGFGVVTVAGVDDSAVGAPDSLQRAALVAMIDQLDSAGLRVRFVH